VGYLADPKVLPFLPRWAILLGVYRRVFHTPSEAGAFRSSMIFPIKHYFLSSCFGAANIQQKLCIEGIKQAF
jgi:hypothetical protein